MMRISAEHLAATLDELTLPEQLWLVEQLVQRIRQRTIQPTLTQETDLYAMAQDPAIQQEIIAIEEEFSPTVFDGLDRSA